MVTGQLCLGQVVPWSGRARGRGPGRAVVRSCAVLGKFVSKISAVLRWSGVWFAVSNSAHKRSAVFAVLRGSGVVQLGVHRL